MFGQDFFDDICALFGSLAAEGPARTMGYATGLLERWKTQERTDAVRLDSLLQHLQTMRAEPRNQLRCGTATDASLPPSPVAL